MKPCTLILGNDIRLSATVESLPKIREDNTCECLTLVFNDIESFQQLITSNPKDLKVIVNYKEGNCILRIYDIFDILTNSKNLTIIIRFKELLTSFE